MIKMFRPPNTWTVTAYNKDRYGKHIRRSKRITGSMQMAKRMEKTLIEELAAIRTGFQYSTVTYGEFLEKEFFPFVDEYSPSEHYNVTCSMRKWCSDIWNLDLNTINPSDVRSILDKIGESCSVSTVKKMRSFMYRSFNLAMEGGLKSNPTQNIKLNKKREKEFEPAILTKEEVQQLLYQTKIHYPDTYYPIFSVALFCGARSGELYAMLRSDVDLEDQTITISKSWSKKLGVKGTKNGKTRIVPIADELMPLMKELMIGPKSEPLLPRTSKWTKGVIAKELKKICYAIGINKNIRFHDLRANFIVSMLAAGASILEVQAIVGHKDLATTNRYVSLSGINVKGSTNKLSIRLPKVTGDNVIQLAR
jgi:integrase